MTHPEEQCLLNRLRSDKLFCQWSPVLNRQSRKGSVSAVEVWYEAECAIRRLRALTDEERDGEIEFLYTDLCGKYTLTLTATSIMAVLYTMLVDAGESVEKADENPHAASCRAILAMFLDDLLFNSLLNDFFARKTDNRLRPVVLPITDYMEEVGDEETVHTEPQPMPQTDSTTQTDEALKSEIVDEVCQRLGDIISQMENQKGETNSAASFLRIARDHKRNVAKIVSHMFDLHMFADKEGNYATSKEKVIKEILAFFGETMKNPLQTLSTAKQDGNYTEVFENLLSKAKRYNNK